jgi:hypothetical protein
LPSLFADGWVIEAIAGGPQERWASFLIVRR